jgi:hypothetical protein
MTWIDASESSAPSPSPPAAASAATSATAAAAPATARRDATPGLGYGNIYTPHAGSMIIQVQRESGLQSRTIVLTQRQVRVLRFFASRPGKIIAVLVIAVTAAIVLEAARVPILASRVARMNHTAQRLDTLERSLAELQKRYDQVRTMMGADAATARAPAAAPLGSANAPLAPAGGDSSGAGVAGGLDGVSPTDAGQPLARPLDSRGPRAARVHRTRARAAAPAVPVDTSPPAPPDSGVAPSAQPDQQ